MKTLATRTVLKGVVFAILFCLTQPTWPVLRVYARMQIVGHLNDADYAVWIGEKRG